MSGSRRNECAKTTRYAWHNVRVGGGGYVTGLVFHPVVKDRIYVRTDVGGIYRWEATERRWTPLLDWVPYPARNYQGVDGIALSRSRSDWIVAACGQHFQAGPSDVLISEDAGETWCETELRKDFGGNREHRMAGECVAVDPDDPDHILVGTRLDGLFRSIDGGSTWARAEGVPTGDSEAGIRSVVFGGERATAYASVDGAGVYASRDKGRTWRLLKGSPECVVRLAAGAGDLLYATARKPEGVYRFSGGEWVDITPMRGREYNAVAVSPHDEDELLVCPYSDPRDTRFRLPLFLSCDRGASWSVVANEVVWESAAPWMRKTHFSAATSSIAYDPHRPGHVWFTDWYAVWRTEDIRAMPVQWQAEMTGHEEMFLFDLVSLPQGAPLLSGMADNIGFCHTDLQVCPTTRIATRKEVVSIDFCERNPDRVVSLSGTRYGGHSCGLYVSDAGGADPEERSSPVPEGDEYAARIACACGSPDNFVVVYSDHAPCHTRDGGRTWKASKCACASALSGRSVWNYHHPLAADRVKDGHFYLFGEGQLFASADGGASFETVASGLPTPRGDFVNVQAAPGVPGLMLMSLAEGGLWLRREDGEPVMRVASVEHALLACWGPPLQESGHPALYLYGLMSGRWGLFRSTGLGDEWTELSSEKQPLGQFPSRLCADRQVPGRVYVGTTGRGIFYGEQQ